MVPPRPEHRSSGLRLLAALALTIVASVAQALPGDREEPIHIESDRAEHKQREGITVYEGSVQLRQGTLLITADKLTVHTNADNVVERIVAEGSPVHFEQQPEVDEPLVKARALRVSYAAEEGEIQLLEDAWLEQNNATMRGNRIDYDMDQDIVTAEGQSGTGSPRIEMVLPPQQQSRDNQD